MKELLSIPHKGVKTLLNCSWVNYLYHLVYFGITTFILLGLSFSLQLSLGSLIGYLLVVMTAYILLTSFLLRLLTGDTGTKSEKKNSVVKTTEKKTAKKAENTEA